MLIVDADEVFDGDPAELRRHLAAGAATSYNILVDNGDGQTVPVARFRIGHNFTGGGAAGLPGAEGARFWTVLSGLGNAARPSQARRPDAFLS